MAPEDFKACYLASMAFAGLSNREMERSWLERALVIAPKNAHIQTSLGISRLRDGDAEAAHAAFDKAVQRSRNFAPARYNRALIELEAMHFARGWSDYEWRFSYPSAPGVWREFPSPV
jgi:lipoprotein NlpI